MVSFKNNGKLKLLIIVGTRPEISHHEVIDSEFYCYKGDLY